MGNSSSILFRGAEAVIDAYEANDVPAWALFCGKDIVGQYYGTNMSEGSQLLAEWLDRLKSGGSSARFQLRIYVNPKSYVDNNTGFNYSIPFGLTTVDEHNDAIGSPRSHREILERLERIEKRQYEEPEIEEPERIGAFQSALLNMLQNPQQLTHLVGTVKMILGGIFSRPAAQPASMGSVPPQDAPVDMTSVYNALPGEQRQALDAAPQILLTKDPQAGERLYKIACILRDNPDRYNLMASML